MLRTLLVLLWRHCMSRTDKLKSIIGTAFELGSPFLVLLLLYFIREQIAPPQHSMRYENVTIRMTDPIAINRMPSPGRIIFGPDTAPARTIMTSVAKKLRLSIVNEIPARRTKGIYAYHDNEEVAKFTINMTQDDALVIFHNMNSDTMPSKLNYTIRIKENFKTHLTDAMDNAERADLHAPHQYFGAIYETFMRLQWSIDSSFLESLSGTSITQTVKLQEFPYGVVQEAPIPTMAIIVVIFLVFVMYLFVFDRLIYRLMEERLLGLRVLIQNVGVSPMILGLSHFINVLPAGIIATIGGPIVLTIGSTPLLQNTNIIYLMMAFFLYFTSVVMFGFVVSFLSNNMKVAGYMGSLIGILSFVVSFLTKFMEKPSLTIFTGLLPHVPNIWLWKNFFKGQFDEGGMKLSKRYFDNDESSLVAFIMLLVQIVLFTLLAAYLYRVRPGPFGIADPWNFLFTRDFWGLKPKARAQVSFVDEEEEEMSADQRFFEPPNKRMEVGIKVVNVSKIFKSFGSSSHTALSRVNLEVYKGEITVLLGHNGAGKTTLMNIITGMYSATEGDVYVNGKHTVREAAAIRKDIGLCPQNNIFWKEMSVLHHVMFFTLLKGVSWSAARQSSLKLLSDLGLGSKTSVCPDDLSGGMKRRLQLACALAGECSVLALDEPTSGLDVETRRELWDLLLKLRGSRTVLLTTHFMEEADALGDRAAALLAGRLRCHATPMFLKRAIGSGYRLTLLTDGVPNEPEIAALVTKHIAAKIAERSLNKLVFNIPADDTQNLPAMFRELEQRRAELHVENIGIGASTLEDVFLRLCSNTDTNILQDEVDSAMSESQAPRLKGFALMRARIWALLVRQFKFMKSNAIMITIGNILIPFALIGLVCYGCNNAHDESEQKNSIREMSLRSYTDRWQVPYNTPDSAEEAKFRAEVDTQGLMRFFRTNNVYEDVANKSMEGKSSYSDYLAGLELNNTHAMVYYTTGVRHAAPAALNFLTNTLAAETLPPAPLPAVTTYNHPLEGNYAHSPGEFVMPKNTPMILTVMMFVAFLIHLSTLYAFSLPAMEKETGARHVHYMTGVSRILYWNTTLLYHMAFYCVTAVPLTILLVVLLDTDRTFTGNFIAALLVALVGNGLAYLSLAYALALLLAHRLAIIVVVVCVITCDFMLGAHKYTLALAEMSGKADENMSAIIQLLYYIAQLNPHYHATAGMILTGLTAHYNALCALNRHDEKNCRLLVLMPGFEPDKCCAPGADSDMISYWSFHPLAPLVHILMLFVLFVAHMLILYFLESARFSRLWERLFNFRFKPREPRYHDANAKAEKNYVDQTMPLVKKHAVVGDEMLARGLHKRHAPLCGRRVLAVNGVSFSVKKGECFGLLGVNGAGKSTTFQMLAAASSPTQGEIYCGGNMLIGERDKYVSRLGYCPQFGGHDGFLTGKDNVALMLSLRGFQRKDVQRMTRSWIEAIGLERYADRKASQYSGGCARRLACIMALCTEAEVTLLDEPSAGVDPAARRRLWAALPRSRALVVTSHSMDEMEALSDRLAIMNAGEICAFGPPSAIRAAYATGHALYFKLTAEAHDQPEEVSRLKTAVLQRYNSELKDSHPTMLNFHINETIQHSVLFEQMEALKAEFTIIEDYGVSETTLEEVFIAFAREGKETERREAEARAKAE